MTPDQLKVQLKPQRSPEDVDIARLVGQLAAGNSVIHTTEDAAAWLDISVAEARRLMAEHAAEIEQAVKRSELAGEHLPALARACLAKLLLKVNAQADTADGFEAVELSKPVLRFLENHDRVQLAKRETENLALVSITFVNRAMQVEVLDKGGPRSVSDVIDVIGHAPGDGGDHATP